MLRTGFLSNILTGADNQSFEAGRVLWVLGTVAFILASVTFQGISVFKGQPFSMIDFGTGFGGGLATILALGGAGISLKDRALAKVQETQQGRPE